MGKVLMSGGGGSGVGSDELTATKDKVLNGYTFVGSDTNDEIGTGTIPIQASKQDASRVIEHSLGDRLTIAFPIGYYGKSNATNVDNLPYVYVPYTALSDTIGLVASKILAGNTILGIAGTATNDGDATAAQILSGKKAYVDGSLITGSMTDRGAQTKTITPSNAAQSYTIPKGYHNGSGKVSVPAIPSTYLAMADAYFFKNGGFGPLYNQLGVINRAPKFTWNGSGVSTEITCTGWNNTYAIDDGSPTWDWSLTSKGLRISASFTNTYEGKYSGWSTRTPIDLTNVSTIKFTHCMGAAGNYASHLWAVNPETNEGVAYHISDSKAVATEYLLDVSDLSGKCLFGMCRSSGGNTAAESWYITEISFA